MLGFTIASIVVSFLAGLAAGAAYGAAAGMIVGGVTGLVAGATCVLLANAYVYDINYDLTLYAIEVIGISVASGVVGGAIGGLVKAKCFDTKMLKSRLYSLLIS